MKILYLYQYFGTPSGSWSTRVYEFTRRWVNEGHEVTVITAPYEKSDIDANTLISHQTIEGIKLIVLNTGDDNRLSVLKRGLRAILFSILSSFYSLTRDYDVLISSSGPITIGLPMILSKILRGKKTVFEVRDLWPDGAIEIGLLKKPLGIKLAKYFEKLCYTHSDSIVPCSEGMKLHIKERFPQVKTLVIPNSSDLSLFNFKKSEEKLNSKSTKRSFIYAGSLGLMDSVEEIIEACSLLKSRNDFVVYIIGSGAEKKHLEDLVQKNDLDSKVKFLGLIPKQEVVKWFSEAYASFVLFKNFPILGTSSPNKMFDSFAAKVPIIHNTNGWISDLVQDYNCGLTVKPNNKVEMANSIEYLLNNPKIRDDMAINAYSLAENNFDRDKLAKDYLNMLEEL